MGDAAVYDRHMDELSPLFQEIEFHERFRGYDPDEVDAYVDRVARAAAVLRGRVAELQERAEAAESRGGASGGVSEAEETLTRTLVLAQRTADAAIAEARVEAERTTTDAATSAQAILSAAESEAQVTLREAQAEASSALRVAEDRATLVMAEAETDRRSMVASAEAGAAGAALAERERLASEVSELQDYRAFLADDIEILERHLTEERHQLTASLSALTDLLESPDAFRASRLPQLSDVEMPEEMLEIVETAIAEPDEEMIDLAEPAATFDDSPSALAADFDPAPPAEPVLIDLVQESAGPEEADVAFGLDQAIAAEPIPEDEVSCTTFADVVIEAPPRLVTAADLETDTLTEAEISAEATMLDDGGPTTAQIPVVEAALLFSEPNPSTELDDDPFLNQLRDAMDGDVAFAAEAEDEALTAFFDQEDDDAGRSWFGRRR
ncbi:MAG: cell division initiation protein [Candidatus Aldehydirespiratoraceae bacterium]